MQVATVEEQIRILALKRASSHAPISLNSYKLTPPLNLKQYPRCVAMWKHIYVFVYLWFLDYRVQIISKDFRTYGLLPLHHLLRPRIFKLHIWSDSLGHVLIRTSDNYDNCDLSSVQWDNQIIQRLISSLFKTSIHILHT